MINWKGRVGLAASSTISRVLSSPIVPLTSTLPRGVSWMYDAQRFSGRRHLPVVFDVGANVGQTLRGMLQYFPRSSIYSFEPVSASFRTLASRYAGRPNVTLVQKAFGECAGVARMPLHSDSELNTLASEHPRMDDLTGESEDITVDTIDSFCMSEGIESIDILKLDVQGWELKAIRGAAGMIGSRRIRIVFSEVGFRRRDGDLQHFAELNDHLEENGFWLSGFYDAYRWGEARKYLGFASALYLNPDFTG
jgi:FkbM family methyltransferase